MVDKKRAFVAEKTDLTYPHIHAAEYCGHVACTAVPKLYHHQERTLPESDARLELVALGIVERSLAKRTKSVMEHTGNITPFSAGSGMKKQRFDIDYMSVCRLSKGSGVQFRLLRLDRLSIVRTHSKLAKQHTAPA